MPRDFLPRREEELKIWSINFHSKISANPESFGLTVMQASAYAVKHEAFLAALATANAPSTRTSPAIITKNDARDAVINEARVLARLVRATPGVTATQRSELGLSPPRDGRGPLISRPETVPAINVVSVIGRTVELQLAEVTDSGNTWNPRKPRGVAGAMIFSFIGEAAPAEVKQWTFERQTTRTKVKVEFDDPNLAPGDRVWLTARWINPRGETGPACAPQHTHLLHAVTTPGKLAA